MRRAIALLLLALLGLLAYAAGIWFERFGRLEAAGEVASTPRSPARVAAEAAAQGRAARALGAEPGRQVLFGDLHVHTTFSLDAFLHSLPLMQGEGAHPPADACDFARFCAGLDFFSINDHAEGLTPGRWRETRESIRQCNAVAGDPADPDLVAFLGWEWTQIGAVPEQHYGHKNVVLRDVEEGRVPTRPIAARGRAFDTMRTTRGRAAGLVLALADFPNRQRAFDLGALRRQLRAVPVCPEGVDVRELPEDCAEAAATPRELFAKLDQWGYPSLVIPHGNAWGNTTPAGVSWDKQLEAGQHDPELQTLIEVYSGHGNSEEYRPWRHRETAPDGSPQCPEPVEGFEAGCWRAGEIVRERCRAAGEGDAECGARAELARRHYLDARDLGRFTVPGQRAADWLEAGQCTDCFQPAFNLRPGGSAQYALGLSRDDGAGGSRRFRFGLIASSDTHFARPASGYKEFTPLGMTDIWARRAQESRRFLEPRDDGPAPASRPIEPGSVIMLPGGDTERSASFYYTGGLVAVHAAGRDRGAIWDALRRKEVYATSGPRILLWFDLLNPPTGAPLPMGGEVRMNGAPRFRVRAVGAFRQLPGCPEDSVAGLGPERIAALCLGECHHPSDERHRIDRIEVVRIRPQRSQAEPVGEGIEDPWKVLPCPGRGEGCVVEFEDPEHATAGRDAVYYVRALQEPTPHVNGDGLRCTRDAEGACTAVRPCAGDGEDACLGEARARAWSSPIFVDFERAPSG